MPRALLLCLLAFIALTPIVWIRPMDNFIALFHVAGVAMLALLPIQPGIIIAIDRAFGRSKAIWISCLGLLAVMVLSQVKDYPPYAPGDIGKYACYLLLAFGTAVTTRILVRTGTFHYLYFAPAVSFAVLALFVQRSMGAAGIDFFSTFARAVESGNPDLLIFPLFKGMFLAELEEVRGSLRHGMAQALLCSALVGIAAHCFVPEKTTLTRSILWGGVALAFGVVLFTFSRSAWLAAFLAALILAGQLLVTGKRLFLGFNLTIGAAMVLAMLQPVQLFVARLESTTSYHSRMVASSARLQEIGDHLWFGATYPPAVKAHNLVLDHWASGGLLGALFAVSLIVAVSLSAMRCVSETGDGTNSRRLLMAATAAMLFMPLVRYFTAPDGLPQLGTWIALGVGAGLAGLCLKPITFRLRPEPVYWGDGRMAR